MHIFCRGRGRQAKQGSWGRSYISWMVKWAGYPESDNTWEHEDQFDETTQGLLVRFWEAIGIEGDHRNYTFGTRFNARPEWIQEEKKRFLDTKEREEKLEKARRKEAKKAAVKEKDVASRKTKKTVPPPKAARKTTVASRPTEANRKLPPPKAGQPQLKTTAKSQAGHKTKSKSVGMRSDSDVPAEDLRSTRPKMTGTKRTPATAKAGHRAETDSDEFILSEEEETEVKPGLKRARVSQVEAASESTDENTAHNRRKALRDKLKEEALSRLKDNRDHHKKFAERAADEKISFKSLSPVAEAPKEKKTFAPPARLWHTTSSKQAQADGTTDATMQEADIDDLFSGDDDDMKDLFGDTPPPTEAAPLEDTTVSAEQIPAPKTPAQKPWKESRIKFYDPNADKPSTNTQAEGSALKPILAKQKILSRIMNTTEEALTEQANIEGATEEAVMEDVTRPGGARPEEDLPDYDEGDNPLPSAIGPSLVDDVAVSHTTSPLPGAHPSMPPVPTGNQENAGKTESPPRVVVDLTKTSSDQPEIIDLMDSDAEEARADSDIVMLDSAEQSTIAVQALASNAGEFFATIWTAGVAITNMKLTRVSALRKFAPKLTFLCRDRRLDLVSYYTTATIIPMLAQSKVLQTGLLMFEPMGADLATSKLLFQNLVHWLHDLSWVAGAYVDQPNERKKRLLILFHSTNVAVSQACQVPPWNSRDGIIIAAVELPESASWTRHVNVVEDGQIVKPPVVDPFFVHYTVEKLHIPRTVLQNELRGKPYCVVPEPSTRDPFLKEDVQSLASTLEYFKAASRLLGEVIDQETVVFIHRRALRTLGSQMQEIIRLRKYPRVYFYCFGLGDPMQDDTVGESEPRLISPRGGIVTFTPQALLDDPMGTVQLVNDLSKKQGWQCYIIPPVLAALQEFKDPQNEKHAWAIVTLMLATTKPEDRLILTESIDCVLERLRAREQVPYVDQCEDQLRDKTAYMWTLGQFELLEADAGKLLDLCRAVATENSPTITMDEVVKKIFEDMLSMQRQPRLLESYRSWTALQQRSSGQAPAPSSPGIRSLHSCNRPHQ
ncbi:hypothetical protein CALVIDRAFT_213250 [Calocera viscosa TUFC12733]|uniref:Chromo domain-containing protein n=1 Tax=Calocera viscosa (strain TUFC12733) TaxID=1330018 RepID=A0A167RCT0_CALVF|nr:hypothetical protein CALVIDRAFT_213250 [Calocera viscosa TUFC12733]